MTNVEEARFALTEKPLKATSINRIKILHKLKNKYTHLLQPLRFAAVMSDFLNEIDVPLAENETMHIGYVLNENQELNELGKSYLEELQKYAPANP